MSLCSWKYESAQFAGGPFYSTSCGEYVHLTNESIGTPYNCPYCGNEVIYKEDNDE
jgi:predicted RNA-binding Zn-ribbon protein involved in translation (DUF1610 family)